jgi:acyl transferase domain-containing protein/acyl carrier protein
MTLETGRAVQDRLAAMLARRLGCEPGDIDPGARFSRYGASSLMVTAVLAELGRELGRALRVTLAWEYPTLAELAAAIVSDAGEPTARTRAAVAIAAAPAADDPVAIVGLAGRFPGAGSPEALFELIARGGDAVSELPEDRFAAELYDRDPEAPGRASTRWAGLLDAVDRFDAAFFGISPREATHMDPQQRLVLELAWEALEDAGIPPRALRGSRTGVFIGAMWSDYAALRRGALPAIAQHTAVGEDLSIIPARVSYTLGLEGPSLAVNTACSSSLVALHLGCQSVASGESTLALVGGVNLLLAPDSLVAMSKFGAMAPDGRCKAFDARANGYVRGEGGGVVVIKRLSRARADGDRVYAVVLGTAVNNDGFSNGLTAPNPRAQEAVLRDAYARAGVRPDEVGFVETHGTGTFLGDPIEAGALGAVLGARRAGAAPLWIGSVKTNIGHLEAAAGIAGLIKACLSVSRGEILPNLHFETPNPHIAFEALGLAVATARQPWPALGERRVAGVSSFGFGGTNAHAVLASDPPEAQLAPPVIDGRADRGGARRVLFVFSPNGAQHPGMVRTLLRDPVFARAFDACDLACRPLLDWSLRDELVHGSEARLDRIDVGQPLLFAVQYALAVRLEACGIAPGGVLGHSVGEVAAACVAGSLDIAEAARVVVERSRLMQETSGRGAMAMVECAAAEVDALLAPLGGAIEIAGYNGPRNTVVSGDADAVARLLDELARRGIDAHRVRRTDIAAHSAHMDPCTGPLRDALDGLDATPARLPIYSTVTGGLVEGHAQDAEYWRRNLRAPVAFEQALAAALQDGFAAIVEISPHPLLTRSIQAIAAARGAQVTAVASQHRDADPRAALLDAAFALAPVAADGIAASGPAGGDARPELFCLSAATGSALAELARRCQASVAAPLAALCHTSRVRRSHLPVRAAVVASSLDELRAQLGRVAASAAGQRAVPREPRKLAVVFAGQGPQWWAMGRELLATEPVFRGVVAACDRRIRAFAGWSLLEVMAADELQSRIHDVDVTQPALFAIQAGLHALLRAWGVTPDAVVGHSLGEIAAAHAAGALGFADAVDMTVARARAMRGASGRGRMLAVALPAAEVPLASFGGRVELAAINASHACVFAGDPGAIEELRAQLAARRVATRPLRGELAFHSAQMRPAQRELERDLAELRPRAAQLPLVSSMLGRRVDGGELSAAYWGAQVVAPVRFADAIDALLASGHSAFLEIAPQPTLSAAVAQCIAARDADAVCVPTLRRGKPERAALLEAIAELHVAGCSIDLDARPPASIAHAALPGYPWQRRRYWLEVSGGRAPIAAATRAADAIETAEPAGETDTAPLAAQLAGLDERARRALLEAWIAQRVASILLLGPGETVDVAQGFLDLGMDSLMVTRLRLELERALHRTLPAPVVFDHPSIRRLAAHLAGSAPAVRSRARPVHVAVDAIVDPIERELLAELAAVEDSAS